MRRHSTDYIKTPKTGKKRNNYEFTKLVKLLLEIKQKETKKKRTRIPSVASKRATKGHWHIKINQFTS